MDRHPDQAGAQPRRRGMGARLGLLAASVLLTAGMCELGLRAAGYRVPQIVGDEAAREMRIEPHAEFVYRGYLRGAFSDMANPVKLNASAFHDVEHQPERASTNTYRLLVVGDSYVAALSVPLEQTFYRRLEAQLRQEDPLGCGSYEVIAMGRGNQAQAAERAYIRQAVPVYRPDAVLLLFFCGNDIMENCKETFSQAAAFARRYQAEIAPRKTAFFKRLLVCPGSRLNGLIAEGAATWYARHLHRFDHRLKEEDLASPELGVYSPTLSPLWERAYQCTADELRKTADAAQELGVPLWIAGLSGPQALGEVTGAVDGGRPARWLSAWCASNAVPYVDLGPAIRAAGGRLAYWRHDGHLNARGNEALVAPLLTLLHERAAARARPVPPAP